MKIVFLTSDNRDQHGRYHVTEPYFGTAMEALLQGFAMLPEEIEVHVISCSKRTMQSPEKLAANIWFHQPIVPKIGWGRTLFLGCSAATRRLIRTLNPDIVHGQGTERDCAMSAVHSGYSNILTLHGNMRVHAARKEQRGSLYYRMAALLETYCLKRTGGVVAISNYTNELVRPLAKSTWLLPNAVDQRYFDIEATAAPTPRILFVGALNERKNPIGLIKACEPLLRSGQCTIHFAGEGNEQSDYWKDFNHLLESTPGTELLGFLDRDALGREFQRTSLLVLPTFEDNCPMVVLEAMAAGLAVAASCVGGVPDLITHEKDGILFDPNHPVEMRVCLERLIQEPDILKRLGNQARITARERFHPKLIAAEHLKIYRSLLSK